MCPLCERDVPVTKHHAKLRRRDKDAVLPLCVQCQQAVHGLYPGTELARRADLWTLDGLRADLKIAAALVFVRKLKPGDRMRMRERRWR